MSGAARSEPHPLRELASQLTIPAAICLCIVVSFAGIALVAPWLAPYDEGAILTDDSFVPPGEDLLLGGDYLGRDLASRLVYQDHSRPGDRRADACAFRRGRL